VSSKPFIYVDLPFGTSDEPLTLYRLTEELEKNEEMLH